MAHIWNITDGDIYVSKNGNDTTGDGSSSNPYASINKATTEGVDGDKIVIGSGLWQEERGISSNKYHFIGDGEVVFGYNGGSYFVTAYDILDILENIIFNNGYNAIFNTSSGNINTIKDDCIKVINCVIETHGSLGYSSKVYFLNSTIKTITSNTTIKYIVMFFDYCTIINFNPFYLYNIFYNINGCSNTIIQYMYGHWVATSNKFYFVDKGYNLYERFTATGVGNPLVSDTTIKLNPKFNNPEIGDYTLQPSSPCLLAGQNNANIGAYGLGYSYTPNSSEFTEEGGAIFSQSNSENDIIKIRQLVNGLYQSLWILNNGHSSGNIESEWIDLQDIRYLLISRLFDNILYDSNGFAASRSDNIEASGETCIYYDFEFKHTFEESEQAAASWKNIRWNSTITEDDSDNGNASGSYTPSQEKPISARYIKIKIYIKEE